MQPNVLSAENGTFARLGALSLYAPTWSLHPLLWTFPFVNSKFAYFPHSDGNLWTTNTFQLHNDGRNDVIDATDDVHLHALGPPKCLPDPVPNLRPPHRSQRTSTGRHCRWPQGERVCAIFSPGCDGCHNPTNAQPMLSSETRQAARQPGPFLVTSVMPSTRHQSALCSLVDSRFEQCQSTQCSTRQVVTSQHRAFHISRLIGSSFNQFWPQGQASKFPDINKSRKLFLILHQQEFHIRDLATSRIPVDETSSKHFRSRRQEE